MALRVTSITLRYAVEKAATDTLFTLGELLGAAKVLTVMDNKLSKGLHVPEHPKGVHVLWNSFLNSQNDKEPFLKEMRRYKKLLSSGDKDTLDRTKKLLPWMGE